MTRMFVPDREPALQEGASRLLDTPLERLSGLAATQPYASEGPWLDTAAVELLRKVAQTHRVGRFERAGKEAAINALTAAELLTPTAQLTEGGRLVTRPLDQPAAALHFAASHLGRTTGLQVWLDEENALLLSGPSPSVLVSDPATAATRAALQQLKFVSLGDLYPVLAAWLGIAPAWNLPVSPDSFPVEVLNQRLRGPSQPPAEADEALTYAWSEPWVLWHLLMDPKSGEGVGYLNAGGAGHYRVVADDSRASLTSIPSANVYRHLVDLVEAIRFGRAPRFA